GIDAYRPPVPRLDGCRNDIDALAAYLVARSGTEPALRTLVDAEATRDAVIGAFREHLGQARTGDVALFAFCGHGSEEPVPPAIADLEPTGRIQTLILFDSDRKVRGRLRRPLADKELSLLIAEVAATGAHVAVILDCCHSGGGTRDPFVRTRGWRPDPDLVEPQHRDLVLEMATARPSTEFVPGALESWVAPRSPHVALSACRSFQTAKEHRVGNVSRGAFSVALVESLDTLGTRTTYRSLLDTVRARVDRAVEDQRPELFPLEPGGLGDALFLDGTVEPVPATFTVSHGYDGWEVDAGLVHGLRAPEGDEAFVLSCHGPDGRPAGAVRVTAVQVGRSSVEPIGWTMEEVAYRAVVADVPLPPAEVQLDPWVPARRGSAGPTVDDVAAVHHAVAQAIATAGPDDSPSPYVRVVDPDAGAGRAVRLRVGVTGPGTAQLTRADGSPIAGPVTGVGDARSGDGPARLVAARLEHVARWEQIRLLGDHPSALADAVALQVYAADDAHTTRPLDRPPLPSDGGYRLEYRPGPDGSWVAPHVYLALRNQSADHLWVAVLDLTDRFRCHAVLDTTLLKAGLELSLEDRRPIPVALPAGRPVVAGASARDWLKVVVSDVEFQATSFDLDALDDPVARSAGGRRAPHNTLERIAGRAISRDIGGGGDPPAVRWAATTVTLEVRIPA
ncbi:MAG: caspase family protein, partial [Ilumatobacteraceae bacterium]